MLATRRLIDEKLSYIWLGHFATGETMVRHSLIKLIQTGMYLAHS